MSPEHHPSESSQREPNRPDSLQPEEVQRRLRQWRPRDPQLDLDAILEAARTPAQAVVPAGGAERHGGRLAGMIAASWVCGAVAGALVMFIALGETASENRPLDSAAKVAPVAKESTEREATPTQVATDDVPEASEQLAASLRMSAFLSELARMPGDMPRSTLRAGTHLSPFASLQLGDMERHSLEIPGTSHNERDAAGSTRLQPPPTRDQLLRDFLEHEHDSVL